MESNDFRYIEVGLYDKRYRFAGEHGLTAEEIVTCRDVRDKDTVLTARIPEALGSPAYAIEVGLEDFGPVFTTGGSHVNEN